MVLGDRCHLHSHVVIDGLTTLGADNEDVLGRIGIGTEELEKLRRAGAI